MFSHNAGALLSENAIAPKIRLAVRVRVEVRVRVRARARAWLTQSSQLYTHDVLHATINANTATITVNYLG